MLFYVIITEMYKLLYRYFLKHNFESIIITEINIDRTYTNKSLNIWILNKEEKKGIKYIEIYKIKIKCINNPNINTLLLCILIMYINFVC